MITAAGRQLSTGWDAEITRETGPGSGEYELVTDRQKVCGFVYHWLQLDGPCETIDWTELVYASPETDESMWLIPLDVDWLAGLIGGGLYLHEIVEVHGVSYKVLIDLTDSF